ncbi:MAG: DTW domain-containing protein [Pseudomonadales bacterium]|nr:DTW domain-containing protein [Pseudomonadales bacterium]
MSSENIPAPPPGIQAKHSRKRDTASKGKADSDAGRKICPVCSRPLASCYCAHISKIDNQLPVVILQHPDETKKALSTVPILELSLTRCSVYRGLDFNHQQELQGLIHNAAVQVALLFPAKHAKPISDWGTMPGEPCLQPTTKASQSRALIVLDGTWRNVRELMLINPFLSALECVYLPEAEGRYRIRKAPEKGQLSTIEAVGAALLAVDPLFGLRESKLLLAPFEFMIQYQIQRMGKAVYRKNYN